MMKHEFGVDPETRITPDLRSNVKTDSASELKSVTEEVAEYQKTATETLKQMLELMKKSKRPSVLLIE